MSDIKTSQVLSKDVDLNVFMKDDRFIDLVQLFLGIEDVAVMQAELKPDG